MNKIAVFFDADNVAAAHAPWILEELKGMGEIYILKIFGNIPARKDWVEFAKKNAIQAFHVPAVKGKNGSDITLTVEVMKTLESRAVNLFVLVSSDSDFSALALAIKERGHKVIGFGEKEKSNERGRKSFSDFVFLPAITDDTAAAKTPAKTAETAKKVENKTSAESKTTPETPKVAETTTTAETPKNAETKMQPIIVVPKIIEPKTVATLPPPRRTQKVNAAATCNFFASAQRNFQHTMETTRCEGVF